MRELVFEVEQEPDGTFTAEALGESIFTQGETWDDLRSEVRDATQAHFFDSAREAMPTSIRLVLRRSEVLAVA